MSNQLFFIYLLIMVGTTYLVRAIPFVAIQKKIENKYVKSFLNYIPYTVLTAMTIPAIFYAPESGIAACVGLVVAVVLSLLDKSLIVVAFAASAAVFIMERLL